MAKQEPIDFNLTKIARKGVEPVERPELSVEDARHQQMMDAIAPFARKAQQKNMTTVDVQFAKHAETLQKLRFSTKNDKNVAFFVRILVRKYKNAKTLNNHHVFH